MNGNQKIWIIDDHLLFAAGLKELLSLAEPTIDISCYNHPSQTSDQAFENLRLIVLDFYIPNADVLWWIQEYRQQCPDVPVVVISSSISSMDKRQCLEAGASAYYPKHAPPEIAVRNLQRFMQGDSPTKTQSVSVPSLESELTSRQTEILIQITRGHSNKKVAQILGISPETVKTHLASIYRIIGCGNRDKAIEWSRRNGLS